VTRRATPPDGRRAPLPSTDDGARDGARDGGSAERGSAVVDFVLVSVLLLVLFLGVIQVALAQHVRSMLVDSAAEGARYGARADRDPDDAGERRPQRAAARPLLRGRGGRPFRPPVGHADAPSGRRSAAEETSA